MKLSNTDKAIIKHYSSKGPKEKKAYIDLNAFKAVYGNKGLKEGLGGELAFLLAHGFRFFAVDYLGHAWTYKEEPLQDPITETWKASGPSRPVRKINPVKGPHASRFYDLEEFKRFK